MRNMDDAIASKFVNIATYTITVGSQIGAIIRGYQDNLQNVRQFHPDRCIIHVGHNDMARHPTKKSVASHLQGYHQPNS